MNKINIKHVFLFVFIIFLFVGIVSANEYSNDTNNLDDKINGNDNVNVKEVSKTNASIKQASVKKNTTTTVSTTKGVIGNNLRLNASVVDEDNNPVNTGYVIFKLNGITLKDNKKLTGNSENLKVNVSRGMASVDILADLQMRHAKNLTAVYAGSGSFSQSRSNTATAEIALKNASMSMVLNENIIKQGRDLIITAKIHDKTNWSTSYMVNNDGAYVYFKVNGITLKDDNGNTLRAPVENNIARINYTVPRGLSGVIDCKSLIVKNHTITAGFVNPNYYPTAKAQTTFNVERSRIIIDNCNSSIDLTSNTLCLNATIKDYLGYNVIGPNKYIVKINGVTQKANNKPIYYKANDGIVQNKIALKSFTSYTEVEIVTQDRLAYQSQRKTIIFRIDRQKTNITINPIANTSYTKNVTITGKLTDIYNHPLQNREVAVTLHNITNYVKTDANGNYRFTNKTTKIGINTVTVRFFSNNDYLESRSQIQFTSIDVPTILTCQATTTTYTDNSIISGYLRDVNGNNIQNQIVSLHINNEIYNTRTDENGKYQFTYKTNKAGTNNITATYNKTTLYQKATAKTTFKVNKKESLLRVYFIMPTTLGDTINITGDLVDYDELPVRYANITLKINDKNYNLKTDKYGLFKYQYKTTKTGTNTVTATFFGGENYLKSTDSDTFTVIQSYNKTFNIGVNQRLGNDWIQTWYKTYDEQEKKGVHLLLTDYYATDMGDPANNLLLNATFYFKNSKGNVIKRQFSEADAFNAYHESISGYTPTKVDIIYRKMTDYEKDLYRNGYGYNLITKTWEYSPIT